MLQSSESAGHGMELCKQTFAGRNASDTEARHRLVMCSVSLRNSCAASTCATAPQNVGSYAIGFDYLLRWLPGIAHKDTQ